MHIHVYVHTCAYVCVYPFYPSQASLFFYKSLSHMHIFIFNQDCEFMSFTQCCGDWWTHMWVGLKVTVSLPESISK